MSGPRDRALEALAALVAGAYPWSTPPSRRLRLWSDVPRASRPCCFLFEGGRETYVWSNSAAPRRTISVQIFVYLDAGDESVCGASQINDVMDALDAALAPSGMDAALGRQTLGGLVHSCRIDGAPFKDPGDLDGDALLVAPVKLVLP